MYALVLASPSRIQVCEADMLTQAYDSHCNLVLGEVEETIYVVDDDDEQDSVRVRRPLMH